MNRSIHLAAAGLCCTLNALAAGQECGTTPTPEQAQQMLERLAAGGYDLPGGVSADGIYYIPVAVHVVRQTKTRQIDVPGNLKTQIRKGDIIGYDDLGPFDVAVELPAWLKARTVGLITPDGPKPIQFEQNQTRLTCKAVTIGAGAMVLIKR